MKRKSKFVFFLQPQVQLDTGRIIGAEALARWREDDGRIISPDAFVPFLEDRETMPLLDWRIYELVGEFLQEQREQRNKLPVISMNISRQNFLNESFVGRLHDLLVSYGIVPGEVSFEVTEDVCRKGWEAVELAIQEIRSYGYHVSLDDFGTGYSSLEALAELEVDRIKLDRSLLGGRKGLRSKNQMLLSAVIQLARSLNMSVLCEGTENLQQINYLRKNGCQIVQGFYFSKPLPTEEFLALPDRYVLPWIRQHPNAAVQKQ